MKKVVMASIFLGLVTSFAAFGQMGKCRGKYFGNIIAGSVGYNYSTYWNQATSENGSKWGSVEGTQGVYNWTNSDLAYNWAKNNGGLFKYHTFVWGSQTPNWVNSASVATLQASVENYIRACSTHYTPMGGLQVIDVVNEPVNTPMVANYKDALTAGYRAEPANAGDLNNPYGWVIWPFQLARKYFPNAKLLINEYNVEMNWNNCRAPYIDMVNAVKNAPNLTDGRKNLIDGVGLQCHGIDNLSAANFKACIDEIWTKTGVYIHITEFDQTANPNEAKQTSVYSSLIPVAWEHPQVAGITFWGYMQGTTWINGNGTPGPSGTDSGLLYSSSYSANPNGERPAFTWLKNYMASQATISGCPAPGTFGPGWHSAPTVTITSPLAGSVFASPATVTISALATDIGGTVTSVAFYNGNTLLGTDSNFPYSYVWNGVGAGSYTIRAIATDNQGYTGTSSSINFSVANITGPPAAAGTITGTTSLCANSSGLSYSISPVAGATSYRWITPSGAVITSPSQLNNITLTIGTVGGTLTVYPINSFGTGTGSSLTVTVVGSAIPRAIVSAPTAFCNGQNATLTATGIYAGTNPRFVWYRNNAVVGSGSTYSFVPTHGDAVFATLTTGGTMAVCAQYFPELIPNGNFTNGFTGWTNLQGTNGASAVFALSTTVFNQTQPSYSVSISNLGTNAWDIQSVGPTWNATPGQTYTLRFFARSTTNGAVLRVIHQNANYLAQDFTLSTAWTAYTWQVTPQEANPQLKFHLSINGNAGNTIFVDDISLTGPNVFVSQSTATSNIVTINTTNGVTPTVTIASSATSVCSGTGVTFTATGTNVGTNPTFAWFRNNSSIGSGQTISLIPAQGDQITARLTAGGTVPACLNSTTASSTATTMSVNATVVPTVSVLSSATTVCSGTVVTFTATGTNAGTNPTFVWFRNNTQIGVGQTISLVPSNNDQITARLTAGGTLPACWSSTTASSTATTMSVNATVVPTVSVSSSATTVCSGTGVTFTATGTNAGTNPTFAWFRNNSSIGSGQTISLVPAQGDQITARLTAVGTVPACLNSTTASSTATTISVNATVVPTVSVSSSATTVCSGTGVTFTATGTNAGTNPTFAWFRNNTQIGVGQTISLVPSNNDQITARLTAGGTVPACLSSTTASSTATTISVNATVVPTVSVSSSATTVCSGTGVTFTATGTNAGTNPTFAWFRNNTQIGVGQTISLVPSNNDQITARLTAGGTVPACLSSTTASSTATTLSVNATVVPTVSVSSSSTTVCSGTGVTFTATGTNAGTNPTFAWFRNNSSIGTGQTISLVPSNNDQITARLTAGGTVPACLSSTTASSTATTISVNATVVPTVSVSSSATTVCSGAGVTFTATGTNAGTNPTFAWFRNNSSIGLGQTISLVPSNNDQITARLTAGGTVPACLNSTTASSTATTMSVNAPVVPTVSVSSSATTVCSGTGVTFTATGTNAGTNPTFAWFRNNSSIGLGQTISLVPSNNDQITARLTAGGTVPACLSSTTASSTATTISVNATVVPTVLVSSSATTVCSGTGVTFTATGTNAGTNPTFAWFRNNSSIGSGQTISLVPSQGDQITARLTAGGTVPACLSSTTASSTATTISVNATVVPTVSVSSSATTVCSGTGVTFTATGTNAGTNPMFAWFRNNSSIGLGQTISLVPSNNDQITARLTAGGTVPACLSSTTASSTATTMSVNATVVPTVSVSSSATTVCSGTGVTFTATGTNAGTNPTFAWFRNNSSIGSGQTISLVPSNNDQITARLTAGGTVPACLSSTTASSTATTISVNATVAPTVSVSSSATTVCSGTGVTFTATGINGGTNPTYIWYVNGVSTGSGSILNYIPQNGDVVRASIQVGGNLPSCLVATTATSNEIALVVQSGTVTPTISITSNKDTVCAGQSISFTANGLNWPTTPFVQWFVNGLASGAGISFVLTPRDLDQVYAQLQVASTGNCTIAQTVTSNMIVSHTLSIGNSPCILPTVSGIRGNLNPIAGSIETYRFTSVPGVTYQWAVSGGMIVSGQGTDSVVVAWHTAGMGTLSVTATNGLGSTTSQVQIQIAVFTEIVFAPVPVTLQLFPNPSHDRFMLSTNENVSYQITDLKGVELEKGVCSNECTIGEALLSGTYVLYVNRSQENPSHFKLVKVK